MEWPRVLQPIDDSVEAHARKATIRDDHYAGDEGEIRRAVRRRAHRVGATAGKISDDILSTGGARYAECSLARVARLVNVVTPTQGDVDHRCHCLCVSLS